MWNQQVTINRKIQERSKGEEMLVHMPYQSPRILHTHTHTHAFFSVMVYHRILSTVPCAIQQEFVVSTSLSLFFNFFILYWGIANSISLLTVNFSVVASNAKTESIKRRQILLIQNPTILIVFFWAFFSFSLNLHDNLTGVWWPAQQLFKDVIFPTPEIYEYIMWERDFADVIKAQDLEIGKVSWTIQAGSI